MYINWYHSIAQSFHYIHEHSYICTWRNSPGFLLSPCWLPFVSPLHPPLLTWHPPSCDRNRPPRSQVACKLTPFAPPFAQLTPPLQIPRTPTAQRLTKTTSGIFRLLLSGTIMSTIHAIINIFPFYPNSYRSFWEPITANPIPYSCHIHIHLGIHTLAVPNLSQILVLVYSLGTI